MTPHWKPPLSEDPEQSFQWGGFILESNLFLPRLQPAFTPADIRFVWRRNALPPTPPPSTVSYPITSRYGGTGTLTLGSNEKHGYFDISDLGAYLLDVEKHQIEFFPKADTPPKSVEHHLVHSVLAMYAGLRGEICLHASAVVESRGEAVVIAGPSGAGKSTAAWRLVKQGWELLSDDAVVLRPVEGGQWVAAPGARTLRLRGEMLPGGWESDGKCEGFLTTSGTNKPLRKVVLLDNSPQEEIRNASELYKSLLSMQAAWEYGTPRARRELAKRTWQMLREVECIHLDRGKLEDAVKAS